MLPYYPLDDKGHKKYRNTYSIDTMFEHMVAEYTGLNMLQVQDLNYEDYLQLRHDAFIYRMKQTDEGLEYLEKAWNLEQTEPDRKSLRDKFGSKGG